MAVYELVGTATASGNATHSVSFTSISTSDDWKTFQLFGYCNNYNTTASGSASLYIQLNSTSANYAYAGLVSSGSTLSSGKWRNGGYAQSWYNGQGCLQATQHWVDTGGDWTNGKGTMSWTFPLAGATPIKNVGVGLSTSGAPRNTSNGGFESSFGACDNTDALTTVNVKCGSVSEYFGDGSHFELYAIKDTND